jgi:ATP-dependent Lon protease
VRIDDQPVRDNERMLTDGFFAEVTLTYDGIHRAGEGRATL